MPSYQGYFARFDVEAHTITRVCQRDGVDVPTRIALSAVSGTHMIPASPTHLGALQVRLSTVPSQPPPSEGDPCTVLFTLAQQPYMEPLRAWLDEVGYTNRQAQAPAPAPAQPAAPAPAPAQSSFLATVSAGLDLAKQHVALSRQGKASPIREVVPSRSGKGAPAKELTYTSLDVETTGLKPARDCIVEVAAVKFDGDGRVLDEFTTLVRSRRSCRATADIHGLRDKDLVNAPSIENVIPELIQFTHGTVLLAHKLEFDAAFLTAEANSARAIIPSTSGVCSLRVARRQLDGRSYGLKSLYKSVTGEWPPESHAALWDARAVMALWLWLVNNGPAPLRFDTSLTVGSPVNSVATPCLILPRPVPVQSPTLAHLLDSFPQSPISRPGNAAGVTAYQTLIASAMEDMRLTYEEISALAKAAQKTGLTGSQLRQMHMDVWRQATGLDAGADWSGRPAYELREALLLAKGLGLTQLCEEIEAAFAQAAEPPPPAHAAYLRKLRIAVVGDSAECEALRAHATEYGAKLAVNVTKTVRWVAADDPDGEARQILKARELGIAVFDLHYAKCELEREIADAELAAFEKEQENLAREEQYRRMRQETEQYWNHKWRRKELKSDPEVGEW